ncbi:sodium- and chloride-dependent glycine transporter 2 [Tachysurus ichikawai]
MQRQLHEGAVGVAPRVPGDAVQLPLDATERKTFCPAEKKSGETDSNKVYGTFPSGAPVPPPVPAPLKDASGPFLPQTDKAMSQNNCPSSAKQGAMVVLGTDGTASVQLNRCGINTWLSVKDEYGCDTEVVSYTCTLLINTTVFPPDLQVLL